MHGYLIMTSYDLMKKIANQFTIVYRVLWFQRNKLLCCTSLCKNIYWKSSSFIHVNISVHV